MTDETKQVVVVLGPYAGHTLMMPADEADAAIEAKWALEPRGSPVDQYAPPIEKLTPEEREAAEAAAAEWAAGVGGEPSPKKAAKPAEPAKRDVHPEPHPASKRK